MSSDRSEPPKQPTQERPADGHLRPVTWRAREPAQPGVVSGKLWLEALTAQAAGPRLLGLGGFVCPRTKHVNDLLEGRSSRLL